MVVSGVDDSGPLVEYLFGDAAEESPIGTLRWEGVQGRSGGPLTARELDVLHHLALGWGNGCGRVWIKLCHFCSSARRRRWPREWCWTMWPWLIAPLGISVIIAHLSSSANQRPICPAGAAIHPPDSRVFLPRLPPTHPPLHPPWPPGDQTAPVLIQPYPSADLQARRGVRRKCPIPRMW